jgi:hypothetical protein
MTHTREEIKRLAVGVHSRKKQNKKRAKAKKPDMKTNNRINWGGKKRTKLAIQSKHKSTVKNLIVAELKNSRLLNSKSENISRYIYICEEYYGSEGVVQ